MLDTLGGLATAFVSGLAVLPFWAGWRGDRRFLWLESVYHRVLLSVFALAFVAVGAFISGTEEQCAAMSDVKSSPCELVSPLIDPATLVLSALLAGAYLLALNVFRFALFRPADDASDREGK
jgi:hypothetical protein